MADRVTGRGNATHLGGKRDHGAESGLLRSRGERPRVAERHRSEAPGFAAFPRPDAAIHVQEGYSIHGAPAELVWRSVAVILESVIDLDNANIGGARDAKAGGMERWASHDRQRGHDAQLLDQHAARETRWWSSTHGS